MDVEGTLSRLIERGLLEEGNDEIALSAEFAAILDAEVTVDGDGAASQVKERSSPGPVADIEAPDLDEIFDDSPLRTAIFDQLGEREYPFEEGERLQAVSLIELLYRGIPPHEGSPPLFMAIYPDQMTLCTTVFSPSLVYVWTDDCEPCDALADQLADRFQEPPDDLALFSVYGPENPRHLQETFDVSGGPALLFMLNGRVDSRIYGVPNPSTIDAELEKLLQLTMT